MPSECDLLYDDEGCCRWCGKALRGRQQRWCSRKCSRENVANHRWTQARAEAKRKATYYECAHCGGYFTNVEVNHIVPCLQKHNVWGCHHHQEGLEVLCPPCHRIVTNEQRKKGFKP